MAVLAVLRAHDQHGLDMLPDHDAYFDVEDREFDQATGTFTLPFQQRADQIIGVDGLPGSRDARETWRFHDRAVPMVPPEPSSSRKSTPG